MRIRLSQAFGIAGLSPVALLLAALVTPSPTMATDVTGPSFDCAKASGSVETLICDDEALAALDHELADVWQQALPKLPDAAQAKAYQRGWIGGRNECCKADDVATCVRDEYERRITELQIQAGLVEVPEAVQFTCESGRVVWVARYENTKRNAAVLTSNDEQVIAYPAEVPAAGTLYLGRNVSLRQHMGATELEWLGETSSCTEVAGRTGAVDPCEGLPSDASFVIATQPTAGATVTSPFEVIGCSRTFESTVTWRLLARDGSRVAEGIGSGGGVDGPRPFRFTVEAPGASGLHHLEVDEPKISDEGFPPGRTVLPLILAQ